MQTAPLTTPTAQRERVILHCDLDNFYASVECLREPTLHKLPVAVCGDPDTRHGIVLAKNPLAKAMGVRTGQALWQARQLCPSLVCVPPHMQDYRHFSQAAQDIYLRFTDQVQPYGIDECWLDVTSSRRLFGSGPSIAQELRRIMIRELGITVSVGVSFNKVFAKLASDIHKPNGIAVITLQNYRQTAWMRPVSELLYVGNRTYRKLERVGVRTIGELASMSESNLRTLLGKQGAKLWQFANGLDTSPVHVPEDTPALHTVGNSATLPRDLTTPAEVKQALYALADKVGLRLRQMAVRSRTLQISLRDSHLLTIERQAAFDQPTHLTRDIAALAWQLFTDHWDVARQPVRALGIRCCDLTTSPQSQLSLFVPERKREEALERAVDALRRRHGNAAPRRGILVWQTP